MNGTPSIQGNGPAVEREQSLVIAINTDERVEKETASLDIETVDETTRDDDHEGVHSQRAVGRHRRFKMAVLSLLAIGVVVGIVQVVLAFRTEAAAVAQNEEAWEWKRSQMTQVHASNSTGLCWFEDQRVPVRVESWDGLQVVIKGQSITFAEAACYEQGGRRELV
jgi:hypothetical protein